LQRVDFFAQYGTPIYNFSGVMPYSAANNGGSSVIEIGLWRWHDNNVHSVLNQPTTLMPLPYETTLDKEEQDVLNQIRKELSLQSTIDVVPFMASVLQALRQTLTLEHATELLNKLPDFMKVVFATNWKQDEPRVPIMHLDEFVCLVMERDAREGKHLLKSEVQALSIVILVLKKMYKLADIEHFAGLSPVFRQELHDASTEVAAA